MANSPFRSDMSSLWSKFSNVCAYIDLFNSLLKIITMFESNMGLIEATVGLISRSKKVVMCCTGESVVKVVGWGCRTQCSWAMVTLITCWFVRRWARRNEKNNHPHNHCHGTEWVPHAIVVQLVADRLCHSLMFIKFLKKVVFWQGIHHIQCWGGGWEGRKNRDKQREEREAAERVLFTSIYSIFRKWVLSKFTFSE